MNIELIVKLVKLANNNPNENEANLAARKVCSLIAAGDYKFNEVKTAQAKVHVKSNPVSKNDDWVRKYYDPPRQSAYYDDLFKDIENQFRDIFYHSPNPFNRSNKNQDPIFDEGREKASKKGKSKVELECIKCQRKVNTAFVGPPQTFVCTICIWEAYMKDKK